MPGPHRPAPPVEPRALQMLFDEARTPQSWLDAPIEPELLRRCYEHARWAPTSANTNPARFVFIVSPEAKARLEPWLFAGNVEKSRCAPCTVIVASDPRFHHHLPDLMPGRGAMAMDRFEADADLRRDTAARNTVLQGAYFIMAARALGLDCGPMSGFDAEGVSKTFLSDDGWKAEFLINLGSGDPETLHPRQARLSFDVATRTL